MTQENQQQPQATVADDTRFGIQKLYVKDMSFEAPNIPQIYSEPYKPKFHLELSNSNTKLEDGVYEVVLLVTLTAKLGEKTAFIAEAHQAGTFVIKGVPEEQLGHALGSYCPSLLFPYVREVISDLVGKGGFPPLYLAPVNFDAIYMAKQEKAKQQQENNSDNTVH